MRSRSGAVSERASSSARSATDPAFPPDHPAPAAAASAEDLGDHLGPSGGVLVGVGEQVVDARRLGPAEQVEHLVLLVGERPLEAPAELLVDRVEERVALGERGGRLGRLVVLGGSVVGGLRHRRRRLDGVGASPLVGVVARRVGSHRREQRRRRRSAVGLGCRRSVVRSGSALGLGRRRAPARPRPRAAGSSARTPPPVRRSSAAAPRLGEDADALPLLPAAPPW